MLNFYEICDILDVFVLFLDKSYINDNVDTIISNKDLFNSLYPPYTALLIIEVFNGLLYIKNIKGEIHWSE